MLKWSLLSEPSSRTLQWSSWCSSGLGTVEDLLLHRSRLNCREARRNRTVLVQQSWVTRMVHLCDPNNMWHQMWSCEDCSQLHVLLIISIKVLKVTMLELTRIKWCSESRCTTVWHCVVRWECNNCVRCVFCQITNRHLNHIEEWCWCCVVPCLNNTPRVCIAITFENNNVRQCCSLYRYDCWVVIDIANENARRIERRAPRTNGDERTWFRATVRGLSELAIRSMASLIKLTDSVIKSGGGLNTMLNTTAAANMSAVAKPSSAKWALNVFFLHFGGFSLNSSWCATRKKT